MKLYLPNDALTEGRTTFGLEHGAFAEQSFTASLRVCGNPCCPCGVLCFECRTETAPHQPLRFDLDVFKHRINTQVQSAPDGVALGRAFIAEAQPTDWESLCRLFLDAKKSQMERMDLDTLAVNFPEAVKAGDGTMVGYGEIFPWAETFKFTREGVQWFVDDQYCVRPGCNCTGSGLSFYGAPTGKPRAAKPLKCATCLHYDYRTGKFEVVEAKPGSPAADVLLHALRAANPDLAETLPHRHRQLKQLGRRLMRRSTREFPRDASTPGEALGAATGAWLLQPPDPRITRVLARTGRNDPCPCGSGKKFKKCCGAA